MSDEYISRRDARIAILEKQAGGGLDQKITVGSAEAVINAVPAADVEPVVRCASCKYVRPTVNAHTGEQVGIWCYLYDIHNVSPDDYCSRGEKKGATE